LESLRVVCDILQILTKMPGWRFLLLILLCYLIVFYAFIRLILQLPGK